MDEQYEVIGFDTREHSWGLPLFRVTNIGNKSLDEVIESIADNQAWRCPHIIYTVVKSSDLWW